MSELKVLIIRMCRKVDLEIICVFYVRVCVQYFLKREKSKLNLNDIHESQKVGFRCNFILQLHYIVKVIEGIEIEEFNTKFFVSIS